MRQDEIWTCINRIGFDDIMHEAGDRVQIRDLDYFPLYNAITERHTHCYRVYLKDLEGNDRGWMMDWIFLKFFQRDRNESWTDMESQEQFGKKGENHRGEKVSDIFHVFG